MNQALESKMDDLARAGREAWKRGDVAEAEAKFLDVWALLPEPRTSHEEAGSLTRGMVTFYKDTQQFGKAKEWLEKMREAYGPAPNQSVEFAAAQVYFDAGDLEEAFNIFHVQFQKFGARPFQGKDKKYLEFYKARARTGNKTP